MAHTTKDKAKLLSRVRRIRACDLPFLAMFPSRIRPMLSISETKNEAIQAALETSETAKEWRSFVVVHVVKIAVIRQIDRVQADANLVPAPALRERQVQMEVPINLRVE